MFGSPKWWCPFHLSLYVIWFPLLGATSDNVGMVGLHLVVVQLVTMLHFECFKCQSNQYIALFDPVNA